MGVRWGGGGRVEGGIAKVINSRSPSVSIVIRGDHFSEVTFKGGIG